MTDAMEAMEVIDKSPFLCALSAADRAWLAGKAKRQTGRRGRVFLWSGESFYVIAKGRFKLVRSCPSKGRELTLLLLAPGDGFEAIGLLDNEPHDVSAVSLDAYELLEVPATKLLDWCESSPGFNKAFLQYLGHQLEKLAELASDLTFLDTHVRLAKLILNHLDSVERGALGKIHDLSDENLANLIGTVRKVVNRHLQDFQRDGVVESRRGHLRVTDIEKLARRAAAALPHLR